MFISPDRQTALLVKKSARYCPMHGVFVRVPGGNSVAVCFAPPHLLRASQVGRQATQAIICADSRHGSRLHTSRQSGGAQNSVACPLGQQNRFFCPALPCFGCYSVLCVQTPHSFTTPASLHYRNTSGAPRSAKHYENRLNTIELMQTTLLVHFGLQVLIPM